MSQRLLKKYFCNSIESYSTLSFVGLERACGKTTVFKAFLEARRDRVYGVSSIGTDHLGSKPGAGYRGLVYVHAGTLVATARQALPLCDATKEILETTGILTPLGEIILFKTLSDGFVFLAGPSRIADVIRVKQIMLEAGAQNVFIDGAVDRKSSAVPALADGVILSSKLFSVDFDSLEIKLATQIRLLQTPAVKKTQPWMDVDEEYQEDASWFLVDAQGMSHFPESGETAESLMALIQRIPSPIRTISFSGAVTHLSLRELITADEESRSKLEGTTLLAEDATKLFIDQKHLNKLEDLGLSLRVVRPIHLLGLGINPAEAAMDKDEVPAWMNECAAYFKLPVFDVLGGLFVEGI
jgi:hypothetical protein